jgi:8-amino-7-oxononanoate synthase
MDGVNSMTGNAPPIPAFARLAREYDALLYVDDAHGFGVIGERSPFEPCDWGSRGNSIIKYFDESYDNIILVGGFSKAYSSLLAFLALPTSIKNLLKVTAPPYLYSGPSPVASLATVLAGFDVNEKRGDSLRKKLYRKTAAVLDCLQDLDVHTPNASGFPIIEIPLAEPERIKEVGDYLFNRGIYVTMAAYPLVPRNEVGFRVQVTAANSDAEIEQLIEVLHEVAQRFPLQPARGSRGKRRSPERALEVV